jgi:hypothetical protein
MELQHLGRRHDIENEQLDSNTTVIVTSSTGPGPSATMTEQSINPPVDNSRNLAVTWTILGCSHISLAVGGFTVS